MDIPVIAVSLIAGLLLSRERAFMIAAAAWLVGLVMVGWGPANNSDVHTNSVGFWAPWVVVLAICLGIVFGLTALRERRAAAEA
jgi:membrane protein DedA with SNARE-associated domain